MSVMMLMTVTVMVVKMVGALHVAAARHHEDVALGPDDLNVGSIKSREYGSRDHLVDGAKDGLPVTQIEHAIQCAQQLIEFMRAEQHRDFAAPADLAHHVDGDFLMARIEADQGFVQQ